MLPELSQLIDLQELDKEILEVTQRLHQLPEELENRALELQALETELGSQRQELEDLQRERRETEAEMADLEEGIKASRQRLLAIKKGLEYKAMIKEIAFKEDQRDQQETRVLELMEAIEAQNQLIAEQQEKLESRKESLHRRESEVSAQIEQLQKRASTLESQRQVLREDLPATLLKRYEFISQRKNGGAIAEVREGVCQGCHLNILPQQFIDLQKGEEILQCPHCQRILYWLGEQEPAEEENLSRRAS